MTELDADQCYAALTARDRRLDGAFFVGVRSTGIYCRPVCTARMPGRKVCTFHKSAASAEQAGFRPCLRCRPERAPGHASVDRMDALARRALARIESGEGGVDDIAKTLGVTARHLRRVTLSAFGASPVELVQTHRLLAAKEMLADTSLPVTEIAYAAGFNSLRRFNALFRSRYRLSPSALRKNLDRRSHDGDMLNFLVGVRPPYAARELFAYLAARACPLVEQATPTSISRNITIGAHQGHIRTTWDEGRSALIVCMSVSLAPVVPMVLAMVRHTFDVSANAARIDAHLASTKLLARDVARRPGIRVAGAFDPFELAVKTVLGQQISMKGARTLMTRLVERFGQKVKTQEPGPGPGPSHYAPRADDLANTTEAAIRAIGLTSGRARTLHATARAVSTGALDLSPGVDPDVACASLLAVSGIGPWTADYIIMRALSWPDACPSSDLWLKRALSAKNNPEAERAVQIFSPWRAYAAVRLWTMDNAATTSKRSRQ